MNQGKIVQVRTPEEVMIYPVDEFVASFVGMETVFSGQVTKTYDGTFVTSISGHSIEAVGVVEQGEIITCFIRPENVILSTNSKEAKTSARNVFAGKVIRITPMGYFYKVQLDCGFPLIAYITLQSLENLALKENSSVFAYFKATAVHVIRRENR